MWLIFVAARHHPIETVVFANGHFYYYFTCSPWWTFSILEMKVKMGWVLQPALASPAVFVYLSLYLHRALILGFTLFFKELALKIN